MYYSMYYKTFKGCEKLTELPEFFKLSQKEENGDETDNGTIHDSYEIFAETGLTSAYLSGDLKSNFYNLFANCTSLSSIILEIQNLDIKDAGNEPVQSISKSLSGFLYGCTSLSSITLKLPGLPLLSLDGSSNVDDPKAKRGFDGWWDGLENSSVISCYCDSHLYSLISGNNQYYTNGEGTIPSKWTLVNINETDV
jgi:hypothetical protein